MGWATVIGLTNPFISSVSRARVSFRLGLKKARALNTISGRVSAAHKAQAAVATGSGDVVGLSGAVELPEKVRQGHVFRFFKMRQELLQLLVLKSIFDIFINE